MAARCARRLARRGVGIADAREAVTPRSGFPRLEPPAGGAPARTQSRRADLDLIAEEIESIGKTERRELVSRLTVLLLHLLKWRFQPKGRGKSWRLSLASARDEIADLIADNSSLKAMLDDVLAQAYRYARRKAAIETHLGEERFPAKCPWSFAQAMDDGFPPE
jgi:hypothetical protein